MRQAVETARVQLEQAQQNLTRQQDLWAQQLTTREALEKAENDVQAARVGAAGAREAGRRRRRAASRRSAPALESARYDLSKVRIESPIDGIVTRRNIQEGETAVIGTMNNAGTVLLTLADMSVIQAEVEVDETNIPNVAARPDRRRSRSTRIPDRTFKGHVTEIGNSPIQAAGRRGSTRAGDELQGRRRARRARCPTCGPASRARPTSRPRRASAVVAVPIPAVAVRELVYDANGQIVKAPRDRQAPRGAGRAGRRGGGAQARPDAQGNRRRVRRPRRPRRVRADQDRASPATSISRCCRA